MAKSADTIFRDFETDGVPASGTHKPKKPEIREWGTWLESIFAAAQAGGGLVYQTKVALNADLAHGANQIAWVVGDSTAANNGIYQKSGASGSGSWARVADLPYSYIKANNAGAGTANAIVATTSIPTPAADGGALIALPIVADNTSSPVTVSFNDAAPLTIKTNAGFDPDAGALTAGMIAAGYKSGTTFRLLTDNLSSSILAAMQTEKAATQAAQSASEMARDEATAQATQATSSATTAQTAASDAQTLVTQATAGFTGFPDGNAYDFGYVTDATTYFDQDWGSITDPVA